MNGGTEKQAEPAQAQEQASIWEDLMATEFATERHFTSSFMFERIEEGGPPKYGKLVFLYDTCWARA